MPLFHKLFDFYIAKTHWTACLVNKTLVQQKHFDKFWKIYLDFYVVLQVSPFFFYDQDSLKTKCDNVFLSGSKKSRMFDSKQK